MARRGPSEAGGSVVIGWSTIMADPVDGPDRKGFGLDWIPNGSGVVMPRHDGWRGPRRPRRAGPRSRGGESTGAITMGSALARGDIRFRSESMSSPFLPDLTHFAPIAVWKPASYPLA